MAQSRFRHYPLYVGNRKMAEMNGVAYDLESGDELQFGAEGVLGVSDGIPTVKIEGDFVQPVQGTQIDIVTMLLGKQYVSTKIVIGGKAHEIVGRFMAMNFQSDSRTGASRGKFTFTGGGPDVS